MRSVESLARRARGSAESDRSPRGESAEQSEETLWARHRLGGDAEARKRLAERYVGLVRHVALTMARRMPGAELTDLEGAGAVGLLQALDGFDPARGFAFTTYAVTRIRGAILDDLRARDTVPRAMRRNGRRLAAATQRLEQHLGQSPPSAEVAAALGIEPVALRRWQATLASANPVLLDDAMAGPFEPATDAPTPYDLVLAAETTAIVEAAIAKLAERERAVVVLAYYEGQTLEQIGERLGVTSSRISQIRTRALGRLRDLLAERPASAGDAA